MKSIQTKFIILILGCVMLSSAVIGGAGVLSAKKVVDEESARSMTLMCSEKACELNGLFSRIEQSVNTLATYAAEQHQDRVYKMDCRRHPGRNVPVGLKQQQRRSCAAK